jgi:hypothetical protein
MAIGCSHGSLADPDAIAAVLRFKEAYKPEVRIHLGDIMDFAAFRHGAPGTKDEAMQLGPDIEAGCNLIERYEPTHVLIGNHDERVFRLSEHHNAIIALAAAHARNEFLESCNRVHARVTDHYDINRSWIELGDTKFIHGFMFNENAMRDHAEHFGRCVIAHLHVAGSANGRRSDHATCFCVGTLANIPSMEYAKTRRSTARWSHALAYGEHSETHCHVELSQCEPGQAKNWRLPG